MIVLSFLSLVPVNQYPQVQDPLLQQSNLLWSLWLSPLWAHSPRTQMQLWVGCFQNSLSPLISLLLQTLMSRETERAVLGWFLWIEATKPLRGMALNVMLDPVGGIHLGLGGWHLWGFDLFQPRLQPQEAICGILDYLWRILCIIQSFNTIS